MILSQQKLESYLWGAATLLRGTIDAGDYKQFIFPLLFYKRLCDVYDEETQAAMTESGGDKGYASGKEQHRFQIPAEAHWREMRQAAKNVGRAIQSAMRSIETTNPDKLYGIFGDAQWTNKDRLSDAMLRDLIEHFSSLELTVANLPEDELGQGYEYLIKKFADDSGHTAAEFYTNRTVVHLMTEMLQPQPSESIYDPTCGSGGMLLSCITHLRRQGKEWRNVRLYGQERNLMTSSIARMNCFLHGIEDFQIVRGDTLSEPKFVQGDRLQRFDVVLANPPYSIKQWDRDAFASDRWGRNLYGTPPQGRADYAFWQHILLSLAPKTGRCAILFPHGVLFRDDEAEMRRKFIEADVIEAVIGLGANLFYNSTMPSCIVVCRATKPKARKGKILFINAVDEVTRDRAQSLLTDDHIERVLNSYCAFKDEPLFSKVASIDEIRANQYSLRMGFYVSRTNGAGGDEANGGGLKGAISQWVRTHAEVRKSIATVIEGLGVHREQSLEPSPDLAKVLLNAFPRTKWTRVHFGDVVRKIADRVKDVPSSRLVHYIGGEHFDSQAIRFRRKGVIEGSTIGPAFHMRFKPGHVLYMSRNPHLRKASMVDFEGLCANTSYVCEAVADKVIPELLPFLMQSDAFWNWGSDHKRGSTNPYLNWPDIAKFEFDLPPLDQQRRIAEILWAVDRCLVTSEAFAEALQEYRQSLLDSIAHEYSASHALASLDSAIESGRPICYGILKPGIGAKEGIPVVKVRDFPDGYIHEADLLLTTPQIEAPFKRSRLKGGDLLISIRGTIGRLAEVPVSLENANITQDTARLSIAPEHNRSYIRALLESRFVEKQVRSRITGLAVKGINIGELRKIQIPLPSRRKQDAIADQMGNIALAQRAASANITHQRVLMSESIETLLGGIVS